MAKKQKRMSRQELKQPDKVEQVLSGWWGRLEQYWKILAAGCVGILIAGAATSAYKEQANSQQADVANALEVALYPLTAPTGEQDPSAPDYAKVFERFADPAAARGAGVERMAAFLSTHGESDMAAGTRILHASLLAEDAAAITTLDAAVNDPSQAHFHATALMALGRRHAAAGDETKAVATYQRLADSSQGATRALAHMAMGDLSNPLVKAPGDAAKAREHYTKAQEALGTRPPVSPDDVFASFSEPYLYSELDNKLALLD